MKNRLIIAAAILLIAGCYENTIDDPLIIPPNFSQIPDLNNPEKTTSSSSEQD
jgi:hypothetical protein